ncbi:MAG TPA: DUF4124 domain-containing protein [Syntrophales bacterium]|nr:DUF4124 domain-containing protein [Syntrophales bacterium]
MPVLLTLGLITAAFAWVFGSEAEAQTIYQYTDKGGTVVLTDRPPAGVKAQALVTAEPAPRPPIEKGVPAGQVPQAGSVTAEEAIRQRDQKIEEVINTVNARDKEREAERQKRFQEADQLDAEARQPAPATRENRQRQYEMMKEADKLRRSE